MTSVLMYMTIEVTAMVLIITIDSTIRHGNKEYGEFHPDNGVLFATVVTMLVTTIASLQIL